MACEACEDLTSSSESWQTCHPCHLYIEWSLEEGLHKPNNHLHWPWALSVKVGPNDFLMRRLSIFISPKIPLVRAMSVVSFQGRKTDRYQTVVVTVSKHRPWNSFFSVQYELAALRILEQAVGVETLKRWNYRAEQLDLAISTMPVLAHRPVPNL